MSILDKATPEELQEIHEAQEILKQYGPLARAAGWMTMAVGYTVGFIQRFLPEKREATPEEMRNIAKEALRRNARFKDLKERAAEIKKSPEGHEALKRTAEDLALIANAMGAETPEDKVQWREKVRAIEVERVNEDRCKRLEKIRWPIC